MVILIVIWGDMITFAVVLTVVCFLGSFSWLLKTYNRFKEIRKLCLSLEMNIRIRNGKEGIFLNPWNGAERMNEFTKRLKELQGLKNSSDAEIEKDKEKELQDYLDREISLIKFKMEMLNPAVQYIEKRLGIKTIWQSRNLLNKYNIYKKEDLLYRYKPSKVVIEQMRTATEWLAENATSIDSQKLNDMAMEESFVHWEKSFMKKCDTSII